MPRRRCHGSASCECLSVSSFVRTYSVFLIRMCRSASLYIDKESNRSRPFRRLRAKRSVNIARRWRWTSVSQAATTSSQAQHNREPHSLLVSTTRRTGDSMSVPGLWAAVAAVAVVIIDALVRRAHRWAWEASLGGSRRARLPPGDMGWPVVGAMWAFLWAFKSGNPDSFIGSFIRR
jgi:hypothetical protein